MPINSNAKGKRGEREASKALMEILGCEARRGQQFSGSPDSPDIITDLAGVHFEVKNTERLNLRAAQEQACADAGEKIPVVMHKYNRRGWWVMLQVKDLPAFCRAIVNYMEGEK